MSQEQRRCIFCGGYSLSKEHIWPKWCAPFFAPKKDAAQLQINMRSIGNGSLISAPSYTRRPGQVITKRLRVVCGPCNNTWMSRLETIVQPILTPLICGQPSILSVNDQRKVTEWMALKVMVAEHAEAGNHVTSEQDRRAFRESYQLPKRFEVRIGRCGKGRWDACFFRVAAARNSATMNAPDYPQKNIQSVVFGIGELLVYAFTSPDPSLTTNHLLSELLPALWPPSSAELSWPPASTLSEQQADNVAHSLEQLVRHPDGTLPRLPRI